MAASTITIFSFVSVGTLFPVSSVIGVGTNTKSSTDSAFGSSAATAFSKSLHCCLLASASILCNRFSSKRFIQSSSFPEIIPAIFASAFVIFQSVFGFITRKIPDEHRMCAGLLSNSSGIQTDRKVFVSERTKSKACFIWVELSTKSVPLNFILL
ncbi:hypothetical protein [Halpernia sp. GG3]